MSQTLFGLNGRLTRTGFWEVLISVVLLDIAAGVAAITALEHAFPTGAVNTGSQVYEIVRWSLLLVAALSIWAVFAAHVKRAHDLGRGGVVLLWALIPILGWLWLLYELGLKPGQAFRNRFGPQPLGHHDGHQDGERRVAGGGHGWLGVRNDQAHGHGHDEVMPGPEARLDWTGDASPDSVAAAEHYHGHYDAGEALMRASEHHEAPAVAEPAAAAPLPAAADHQEGLPTLDPSAELHAAHDDLSAAMGEIRAADQHIVAAEGHRGEE